MRSNAHIVRRIRWNLNCSAIIETIEESTFATEGELSGYKGHQLPMSIGQGQLPLTTLPLFAEPQEVDP